MPASVRYTIARLGLLFAALTIGAAAGLRGLPLWVAAILASGVASYFLLGQMRDAMGAGFQRRIDRINARIDANTRKEDID